MAIRTIMLSLGALVMSAGAALASDKKAAGADAEKIAVVMEMVEAWNTLNWDRVINLFAEDGVLHSMMVEPIVGRESIAARITHLGAGTESITLNLKHIGVIDDVVFIERIDEFVYNGHAGKVPVVGVLEVENGLIKEWREYYDRNELLEAMGLSGDFDEDAR